MLVSSSEKRFIRRRIVNNHPPVILRNFKDRIRDLFNLRSHLLEDGVCLISVVGQPGIGKTSLVTKLFLEIEGGEISLDESTLDIDGIVYLGAKTTGLSFDVLYSSLIELLAKEDSIRLRTYWANASDDINQRVRYLVNILKKGRYLIYLDNFEDILDEESNIVDEGISTFINVVLTQEHGMSIVITSSKRLQISPVLSQKAARVWLKDGLPLEDAIDYLRDLDSYGDLGLQTAPRKLLSQIAEKTYGIPRALELTASLLASDLNLTIEEMLSKEQFFVGEIIDNLVRESYEKLPQNQKRAIRALAVYGCPVRFVAVSFMMHSFYPDIDVAGPLRWLVNRHFVIYDRSSQMYGLHPLTQLFVYSTFTEEELEKHEKKASEFYTELQLSAGNWLSIDDLEPHLRRFEHLIRAREFEGAALHLEEFDKDILRWGHYKLAHEMRLKLDGKISDKRLNCINYEKLGRSFSSRGNKDEAQKYFGQAFDLAKSLNDPGLLGQILSDIGLTHFSIGSHTKAMELYEQAINYARSAGDLILEAHILGCMGNGYRRFRQTEKSLKCFYDALEIDLQIDNQMGQTRRYFDLGITYFFDGDYQTAIDYHKRSLEIARRIRFLNMESKVLGNLGHVYLLQNDAKKALACCEEALELLKEMGLKREEGRTLARMGDSYFRLNDYLRAFENHSKAYELAQETEDYDGVVVWLTCAGIDLLCLGKYENAILLFHKAIEVCLPLLKVSPESHNLTRYYLSMAYLGLAVTDKEWDDSNERSRLLNVTLAELTASLSRKDNTATLILPLRVIVRQLQKANIEGIKPYDDLLQSKALKI